MKQTLGNHSLMIYYQTFADRELRRKGIFKKLNHLKNNTNNKTQTPEETLSKSLTPKINPKEMSKAINQR
jgi:hypothetical protein